MYLYSANQGIFIIIILLIIFIDLFINYLVML